MKPIALANNSSKHANGGRLAGSVRSEEPEELPFIHLKADSVHSNKLPKTFG